MTHEAEEVLRQQRSLESELYFLEETNEEPELKNNSEIKKVKDEIDMLSSLCDNCEGEGKVPDYSKVNCRSINLNDTTCPECKGRGIK